MAKTFKNGDKYAGQFNKYNKQHGKGKYTFANGDVYEGEFKNGNIHFPSAYVQDTSVEGVHLKEAMAMLTPVNLKKICLKDTVHIYTKMEKDTKVNMLGYGNGSPVLKYRERGMVKDVITIKTETFLKESFRKGIFQVWQL